MAQRTNRASDHSLGPDIYTGWKPSYTQRQFKQFPIFFTNPPIDKLSKSLTTFGVTHLHRIVYMGPRYSSNYKAFKSLAKKEEFQEQNRQQSEMYGEHFQKYQFHFASERQKPFPIRSIEYRLFTGMNPTIKKDDLKFDSNFECGNLDLAISVSPVEYDLMMRVDSNTKGHTTWFYFKVSNFRSRQKIKFNIINFQKSGLLYNTGLKPYCFSSSKKVWKQSNVEIQYKNKRFRYSEENSSDAIIQKCLSFTYTFDKEDEYVYFAYCVPYSYSFMLHQVHKLQKEYPHILTVEWNQQSTGGLVIPVLTITNNKNTANKQTLLAIARLHPGETQGSWTMDGFMKFVCSPKAHYLRQKLTFKIIPMVNVDGVVLGNFRTSISGRDLNRVFHNPDEYKQVKMIRKLAQRTNPLIFLDFHGHSAKKNVFMYGPNYPIDHKHYLTSRIFPKILSKNTPAFRYYSCVFKISQSKINTGRSFMLNQHNVSFAYTIQSSTYAYGVKNAQICFNSEEYSRIGSLICESLIAFIKIVFRVPKRELMRKSISLEAGHLNEVNQQRKTTHMAQSQALKRNQQQRQQHFQDFQEKQLMAQLMLDQKLINEQSKNQLQTKQNDEASDSDFQQGCEYTDKELRKMMKQSNSLEDFPSVVTKDRRKKTKKKKKHGQQISIKEQSTRKLKKQRHFVKQRSEQVNFYQLSPLRQIPKRKIKQLNIQELTPNIAKVKSSIFQTHKTVADSQVSPTNAMNKVHYKNWRKNHSQMPEWSEQFVKAQSVNHITLDYQQQTNDNLIQNQRQKRQRDLYLKRRLRGERQREKQKQKEKRSKPQQVFYVKQSVLPVLNRNSFNQRRANLSLLDELLEHTQRFQKNYARKNLKIMYF